MQTWGPCTWKFFHILAEKIKVESYDKHFPTLWRHFNKICNSLPCPYCSEHAQIYLRGYKHTQIKNKTMFKQFIYQFHNEVNVKTGKVYVSNDVIQTYENESIGEAFNAFYISWNKVNNANNMKLLAHGFLRKKTIHDFHIWFYSNLDIFDMN